MSAPMRALIAAAKLGDKFETVVPERSATRGIRRRGGARPGTRGARSGGLARRELRAGPGPNTRFVAGEGLSLRSEPNGESDDNVIATLNYGDVAKVSGQPTANGYIRAKVELDGGTLDGFLATTYLREPEAPEIERLVREATDEWKRFDRGNGVETAEPYSSYIHEMWVARGESYTGQNTNRYWSAAFISFILENANYTKTRLSTQHSVYIHEAIQNRITGANRDFWGYRRREAKPQVGDLICQWRGEETTFDEAEMNSDFPGHTDLVIAVRQNACITLGGNVSNGMSGASGVSVDTKIWTLDEDGFLPNERKVFAADEEQLPPALRSGARLIPRGIAAGGLRIEAAGACREQSRQPGDDLARQPRAAIDHAGVELEEVRAGEDLCHRRLGGIDAADADQHQVAAPPAGGPWPASPSTGRTAAGRRGRRIPSASGWPATPSRVTVVLVTIRPSMPGLAGDPHHRVERIVVEVGRDLDEERHPPLGAVAGRHHRS